MKVLNLVIIILILVLCCLVIWAFLRKDKERRSRLSFGNVVAVLALLISIAALVMCLPDYEDDNSVPLPTETPTGAQQTAEAIEPTAKPPPDMSSTEIAPVLTELPVSPVRFPIYIRIKYHRAVNIRARPSSSKESKIIYVAQDGEQFLAIESVTPGRTTWFLIVLPNGYTGYIADNLIEILHDNSSNDLV